MWPFSGDHVDASKHRKRGELHVRDEDNNHTAIAAKQQLGTGNNGSEASTIETASNKSQSALDESADNNNSVKVPSRNALNWNYDMQAEPSKTHGQADDTQRMSMHPINRIMLIGGVSAFAGFGIGSAVGSTNAGLRFRAENAHNPPRSTAGWYLYNKSKQYHVILGGLKEGLKAGVRYGSWATLFLGLEEGLDRARGKIFASKLEREDGRTAEGQRDFLNTISSAIAVVGIGARWYDMDPFTTARLIKTSLRYALFFGLGQDLISAARTEGPWYVRLLRGSDAMDPQPAQRRQPL